MINIDLTTLDGWNNLPGGTYSVTVGAIAPGYERIKQSTAVNVSKNNNIIYNISNGTYVGPNTIAVSGTATITVTPDTNYELPNSIIVTNADYTYNDTTGVISLSNPSGNVTIEVVCQSTQPAVEPYLTFSSPNAFDLGFSAINAGTQEPSNIPTWDGTMEYSTDTINWYTWDMSNITAVNDGSEYKVYLRGINNTAVSADMANYIIGNFVFSQGSSDISVSGNIETLLDYQTVVNGNHPAMAMGCFVNLFMGTPIKTCPSMPATTLTQYCYNNTYAKCSNLETLPQLSAMTLAEGCYMSMFSGDSKIKLSATQTGEYQNEYRIPTTGTGTTATNALFMTFQDTGGTAVNVNINTTYYTSNAIVNVDGTITPAVFSYPITTTITNGTYIGDTVIVPNGIATITITPNIGYEMPTLVEVTGASYNYDSSNGIITLSNPTADVTVSALCQGNVWAITTVVTNGTYAGASHISSGETAVVTITPNTGYTLPSTVDVSGASYDYDSSTGVITLSNPTGNVVINAVCEQSQPQTQTPYSLLLDGPTTIQAGGSANYTFSFNDRDNVGVKMVNIDIRTTIPLDNVSFNMNSALSPNFKSSAGEDGDEAGYYYYNISVIRDDLVSTSPTLNGVLGVVSITIPAGQSGTFELTIDDPAAGGALTLNSGAEIMINDDPSAFTITDETITIS